MTARSSEARLAAELDRLAALDLAGLRRRWSTVFGRPLPEHLPRWLAGRILAHRLQVDALGDLDQATVRKLDRIRRDGKIPPLSDLRIAKPGTLLVREWEGTLQRVMVMQDGFAWNGKTYDSLSAAALAITGTKWNGPRFFGLRSTGSQDRRTAS